MVLFSSEYAVVGTVIHENKRRPKYSSGIDTLNILFIRLHLAHIHVLQPPAQSAGILYHVGSVSSERGAYNNNNNKIMPTSATILMDGYPFVYIL